MNATAATDVQADLAFREERRKYLGGSDIAAMLGIAPATWRRNTPLALFFDKTEPPKPDTQGRSYKRRGKRWEAVVGEMLVEKLEEHGHKVEVLKANERYKDPDFNYFACEIDYEIRLDGEEDITNVELKTVQAPVWYTAQAMWGLGITRRRRCIIAPLFGADEIRIYPVPAAADVIGEIRETGRKFWMEHVIARVPPLPGGLLDMARLFPNDCGRTVELGTNEAFVDALVELRAADEDFDSAKARWEAAEYIAKQAMGDAAIATIGGHKACSWKTQKDRRMDIERLKTERPDIYNEFLREKDIRKFLLSRKKEK
jgi:predicted phage-related endonuclease